MRVIPDRVVTKLEDPVTNWGKVEAAKPNPTQPLPGWVFVRDDGWAIGARDVEAPHAFELWDGLWIAVLRVDPVGIVGRSMTPATFLELCQQGELGLVGERYLAFRGKRAARDLERRRREHLAGLR